MKSSDELALDEFSSKIAINDDVCATNYLNFIYSKYRTESKTSDNTEKNLSREKIIRIFEDELQLNSIQDKLPDDIINNNDEDIIDIKKNLTYSGSCVASEYCSISPMIDNFVDSNDDELLTTSCYQPSYFSTTTTTTTTTNATNSNNNETAFDIFRNDGKNNHGNNVSLNFRIANLTLGNLVVAPNLPQQNYYEEMIRNKAVTCDADLFLYSYMQQKSLNSANENDPIEDEYVEINYDDDNSISEDDEYELVDINNYDLLNVMNEKLGNIKFVHNIENKTSDEVVEFF